MGNNAEEYGEHGLVQAPERVTIASGRYPNPFKVILVPKPPVVGETLRIRGGWVTANVTPRSSVGLASAAEIV